MQKIIGFLIIAILTSCEFYEPYEIREFQEIDTIDSFIELSIDEPSSSEFQESSKNRANIKIENLEISPGDNFGINQSLHLRGFGFGQIEIEGLDLANFDELTFTFWIKSYAGRSAVWLLQGDSDDETNKIQVKSNILKVGNIASSEATDITTSVLDGEWNMVTIAMTGINSGGLDTAIIYTNGATVDTSYSILTMFDKQNPLILFKELYGSVDNIKLFSKQLDADEVLKIFTDEKPRFPVRYHEFAVPEGLAVYFNFDNYPVMEVKEGRRLSGSLTAEVSHASTSNNIGQSVKFDGVSDEIVVLDNVLPEIGAFTISFWVKYDSLDQEFTIISDNQDIKSEVFYQFGKILCSGLNAATSFRLGPRHLLERNEWLMIALTCEIINTTSGSKPMKLYVYTDTFKPEPFDVSPGNNINFPEDSKLVIGVDRNGEKRLSSAIDNLRIYNRVLNSQELESIFNSER